MDNFNSECHTFMEWHKLLRKLNINYKNSYYALRALGYEETAFFRKHTPNKETDFRI